MKRFTFIIALLGIALMGFAKPVKEAKDTSKFVEVVATTHEDAKTALGIVHDDIKGITTTLYGDGKEAIASLYPEVKGAVIEIAKAIGCAAEHVYGVLVKKYVVDGIVQLLPFLLGLALIIVGWIKISTYFKKNEKIDWHIIYPVLLISFGFIALCSVDYNTMVMGLVNPEYGALNYILEYSKEMLK